MQKMDRRRFLLASAATAASLKSFAQTTSDAAASAPSSPIAAQLTLHPDKPGPIVPHNFLGLSHETQQLSVPSFFAPTNHGLIQQFRALAPYGVLRIGGNTSDVGWWKPTPDSAKPPLPANVVLRTPPGEKSPEDLAYAITPEAVRNLRAFLDATGWTCIYGINLGTNTPELAADQAVFVHHTLGDKLEYFQIGNEPDGFPNRFRDKASWNANTYFDDWLPCAKAIQARIPEARFGLPDVAGNVAWLPTVADRLAALPDHPTVAALSHHYYFGGPPSNPKVNIDALLHPDPKVQRYAEQTQEAAAKIHVPFRMTEGNTCYRGGKPGVSDVFAASLWAADYLLRLASYGYSGVNLHGGEGKMVADSLGGTLPGEALMPDPTVPHPRPFYTPIADIGPNYYAEPVNFGMRFAGRFAGATLIGLDFDPGSANATAYAAKLPDGEVLVAILNKDDKQDLALNLPYLKPVATLTAPSLTSKDVHFPTAPKETTAAKAGPGVHPHKIPAASAALFETKV